VESKGRNIQSPTAYRNEIVLECFTFFHISSKMSHYSFMSQSATWWFYFQKMWETYFCHDQNFLRTSNFLFYLLRLLFWFIRTIFSTWFDFVAFVETNYLNNYCSTCESETERKYFVSFIQVFVFHCNRVLCTSFTSM